MRFCHAWPVGILLFFAFCARAGADILPTTSTARALALGESLQAASVGEAATLLNPAGLALTRAYVIEGDFGITPHSGKTAGISVCDSVTARVAACLYYDFLVWEPPNITNPTDKDSGTLHRVGIATAVPIAPSILFGLNQKWSDYDLEDTAGVDAGSASGYVLDAGLLIKLAPTVNVGIVGYNLITTNKDVFNRGLGGGVGLQATNKLLFTADARYNFELKKARYSGAIEFFLSPKGAQQGFPLRVAVVYDRLGKVTSIAGGLGYITPKIALDFGMRKDVKNGDDLVLEFGLRMFLPAQQ